MIEWSGGYDHLSDIGVKNTAKVFGGVLVLCSKTWPSFITQLIRFCVRCFFFNMAIEMNANKQGTDGV